MFPHFPNNYYAQEAVKARKIANGMTKTKVTKLNQVKAKENTETQ